MNFLGFRGKKSVDGASNPSFSVMPAIEPSGEGKQKRSSKTFSILRRLETSTTPREIRETLGDLRKATDLADVVDIRDVRVLFSILHNFDDDDDLVFQILKILCLIGQASNVVQESRPSDVNCSLKRHTILKEMAEAAPILLDILKSSKMESQRLALVLLHAIAESDYSAIHKAFLSPSVCEMVVELATSTAKALQEECLPLLILITTVDTELQAIFGQEKMFERLLSFAATAQEVEGCSAVTGICTVVHNIIRGNDTSQLCFVEGGYHRYLITFFEGFISLLRKEWKTTGGKSATKGIGSEELQKNLLSCLQIVSCILDAGSPNFTKKRDEMIKLGIFEAVAPLALCGNAVDDALRIAALRVLAELLTNCEETVGKFLNLDVISLRRCEESAGRLIIWSATRALIENIAGEVADAALLDATLHCFASLLKENEKIIEKLVLSIFKGVATSSKAKQSSAEDSGQVFLEILFQNSWSATSKYYAAHLLRCIVSSPTGAKKFLSLSVSAENKLAVQWGSSDDCRQKKDQVMLFDLYFSYTISMLQRCLLNTTTLSAYIGVLFFLASLEEGVQGFVSPPSRFTFLLKLAASESESSVHVRFWCGALAALVCVNADEKLRDELHKEFESHLGGVLFFRNTLFDVKASTGQWESPAVSSFACGHPVLYDLLFVELLKGSVDKYKEFYTKVFYGSCDGSFLSNNREGEVCEALCAGHRSAVASAPTSQNEVQKLELQLQSLEQVVQHHQTELQAKDLRIQELSVQNEELQNIIIQVQENQNTSTRVQPTEKVVPSDQADYQDNKELQETVSILSDQITQREAENAQLVLTIQSMDTQLRASGFMISQEIEELKSELQRVIAERDNLLTFLGCLSNDDADIRSKVG